MLSLQPHTFSHSTTSKAQHAGWYRAPELLRSWKSSPYIASFSLKRLAESELSPNASGDEAKLFSASLSCSGQFPASGMLPNKSASFFAVANCAIFLPGVKTNVLTSRLFYYALQLRAQNNSTWAAKPATHKKGWNVKKSSFKHVTRSNERPLSMNIYHYDQKAA